MNKKNLQIMYNWLIENQEKIKPNFNISCFRSDSNDVYKHICNSTGCLIGWGVGAFPEEMLSRSKDTSIIYFSAFSIDVLNMYPGGTIWEFIFGFQWSLTAHSSFDDAISRYKHVLDDKPIEEHEQYETFLETFGSREKRALIRDLYR